MVYGGSEGCAGAYGMHRSEQQPHTFENRPNESLRKQLRWYAKRIALLLGAAISANLQPDANSDVRRLPRPRLAGRASLEETIAQRRSVREFAETALTAEQIGQLCLSIGVGLADSPDFGNVLIVRRPL